MRSLWIGTLAAALSCSTPGWSQMLQPDRWIMVREEGKPPVKCRVVSTKKMKDGNTLCQAKTESGEAITLLEEAVKGMPSGTMRMRVLPGSNNYTASGPLPGVAQPPVETRPLIGPTPTSSPPALKPVPPPTVRPAVVQAKPEDKSLFGKLFPSKPSKPEVAKAEVVQVKPEVKPEAKKEPTSAIGRLFLPIPPKPEVATAATKLEVEKKEVVQAKPEPKKEPTSAFGRLFLTTPAKPEVVKAADKKETVVKTTVEPAALESRPILPISTTTKDDPLSRPDLYTKNSVSAPPATVLARTTLFGRIFDRSETPAVTTPVEMKVVALPAPLVPDATPPKATVVRETKESGPSLLDKLRSQVPKSSVAKPVAASVVPRNLLPTGMGSVVATRDRSVAGQSIGGAMVRTPTGAMAFVPGDHMPQNPNLVPVSASNAFTLAMPGYAPGMPGSMPMMPMQQAPASYQQGVPEGAGNAFTMTSSSRPVPADFGPPPQYPNAFLNDGMGGAYSRPMALSYDPRMGYVPVGGGYPQQHPMIPMPHPAGQMLAMLRGSIMPSERERAVQMLSQCNWHAEPEAVAAIVLAAKSDPAPTVRISCVRALARMKVGTMPVFETLQELKDDKDARVRQEAERTLATMTKH